MAAHLQSARPSLQLSSLSCESTLTPRPRQCSLIHLLLLTTALLLLLSDAQNSTATLQMRTTVTQQPMVHLTKPIAQPALINNRANCNFGTLPGVWTPGRPVGQQWRILQKQCPLENLLSRYLHGITTNKASVSKAAQEKVVLPPPANSTRTPPAKLGVLFLSDSTDYHLMRVYCSLTNGVIGRRDGSKFGIQEQYKSCLHNSSAGVPGNLNLGQMYIITHTNQSEVNLSDYKNVFLNGYHQRYLEAKRGFLKDFGREPDAVVVAGGLWDVFYLLYGNNTKLEREQIIAANYSIPASILDTWMGQFRGAVQTAKKLFPQSQVIYHNYAFPKWNATTGVNLARHVGSKRMIAEVVAAGMTVALDEGIPRVNVNQMVAGFSDPSHYLFDQLHPGGWITLEYLNVILNIVNRFGQAPKG